MKKLFFLITVTNILLAIQTNQLFAQTQFKVISTKKTSTAEKEINEAAESGFRFEGVSGGETSVGGSEVVVIMSKPIDTKYDRRFQYKLLATKKTGTMQKELQEAGEAGFDYKGQTVFQSFYGGQEIVVILEKDLKSEGKKYEYKLLATSKTSTMQKELNEVGESGFKYIGLTTGQTSFGGKELVVITKREMTSASTKK
jgi:hypothetical protein